jgi:hypothetical protein
MTMHPQDVSARDSAPARYQVGDRVGFDDDKGFIRRSGIVVDLSGPFRPLIAWAGGIRQRKNVTLVAAAVYLDTDDVKTLKYAEALLRRASYDTRRFQSIIARAQRAEEPTPSATPQEATKGE